MDSTFFTKHRDKLATAMPDNSVLLVFAGRAPYHSADYYYSFIVNKSFYYLTGTDYEKQVLMLTKAGGTYTATLFIDPVDEMYQKWNGYQMTPTQATAISGINDIRTLPEFDMALHNVLNGVKATKLFLDLTRFRPHDPATLEQAFAHDFARRYPGITIADFSRMIMPLRMVKTDEEVAALRKAISYTGAGIKHMLKNAKQGMSEGDLDNYYTFGARAAGAKGFTVNSIVASGRHACILHYHDNSDTPADGDLVLCDLGASCGYYGADISRTFPISGKFTERQRVLYDIVLRGNYLITEKACPGVTLFELNDMLKAFYAKELKVIGLIQSDSEVANYYYHNVGHYLGLNTHDVGDRTMMLEAGNIITVEPGLYIAQEKTGIRIEDDVLITETGSECLSAAIPKEMDAIEAIMRG